MISRQKLDLWPELACWTLFMMALSLMTAAIKCLKNICLVLLVSFPQNFEDNKLYSLESGPKICICRRHSAHSQPALKLS